jgi:WD40 repeat protein
MPGKGTPLLCQNFDRQFLQNIFESHQFIPSNRIVDAFVLKYSQRLIVGGPSRIFSREIVVPKPFTFDSATCCALNTDRSQIITIDKDCLIQVWDSRSGGGMYVPPCASILCLLAALSRLRHMPLAFSRMTRFVSCTLSTSRTEEGLSA